MTPLEVAIILIAHFLKNIPLGKIYTNRAIKQRQLRTGLDKTQRINNIKGRKGSNVVPANPGHNANKPQSGKESASAMKTLNHLMNSSRSTSNIGIALYITSTIGARENAGITA